jgi:3-phosphoshikimate 1-carboxyvinyltransferase
MEIFPPQKTKAHILLPSSKSISNRVLMMNFLSGNKINIKNLSNANDTLVFQRIISCIGKQNIFDAEDAGTALRFATALLSVIEGKHLLTGTDRMKQRPIGVLAEALQTLGINIEYVEKKNFPPVIIYGKKNIDGGKIKLRADISSQYISSLMMIAPLFKNGLTITFDTRPVSMPYIKMTAALMQKFGIELNINKNLVEIKNGIYKPHVYQIENDWSAASYWYLMAALSNTCQLSFDLLHKDSLQGDSIIHSLFYNFGVETVFNDTGCTIIKTKNIKPPYFEYDFTDCPDLAQTFACLCAALKTKAYLKGLKTLKIKETDRIEALKNELAKFGAEIFTDHESLKITGFKSPENAICVNTYNDHRMAMSFAPLSILYGKFTINNPEVVKKSYPGFWNEWNKVQ